MLQVLLLFISSLVFSAMVSSKSYDILAGKTGNGKSYIASALGCLSKICDGTESCTKEVIICDNLIDTIGLDDDGKEYKIQYSGTEISLSGFTYPVYNLFDQLEKRKISDVKFYFVVDANNPRGGLSSKFFLDFVTLDLKCPVNKILNKYRDNYSTHHKVKNEEHYEVVVPENAQKIDLNGQSCQFGLSSDWREKVISSDLAGVISKVDLKKCQSLLDRRRQFDVIMKKNPKGYSDGYCGYEKIIDYVKTGNSWSVNIGPISFGGGGGLTPITERKVDEACALKEKEKNEAIRAENENLNQEKIKLYDIIAFMDEKLVECKEIANFKFDL